VAEAVRRTIRRKITKDVAGGGNRLHGSDVQGQPEVARAVVLHFDGIFYQQCCAASRADV
jgi:hypothetical protein